MPDYQSGHKTSNTTLSKMSKFFMKSYRFRFPNYELPLRLRPWFIALTCMIMVLFAFLGFVDFPESMPLRAEMLHFLCFSLATGVFYFILDVDESARRIWFWRYFALIFTVFTCSFCGGILSEVVQSLLPYKDFQPTEVLANLLGSTLGLIVSFHLEKYYRHRREIRRLYRPLDNESLSDFEDDLESFGTQLLPTHSTSSGAPVGVTGNTAGKGRNERKNKGNVRFVDVWDTREELFEIGEESDEDEREGESQPLRSPRDTTGGENGPTKQAVLT